MIFASHQKKPTQCANTGQAKGDPAQRQGSTTKTDGGLHNSGLTCYSFSSSLRSVGEGLGQFWHEKVRVVYPGLCRNAAPVPVAYPLRAIAAHVQGLSQFDGATELFNKRAVLI